MQTMSNDVLAVIKEMYGDSPPAIVLVGHRFFLFLQLICHVGMLFLNSELTCKRYINKIILYMQHQLIKFSYNIYWLMNWFFIH